MAHKILILDDDADFNSLLTDIFEQADYEVTSSEDPLQAQSVFSEGDFDLVVTDHRMPEMTGSEFMQKIKAIRPEVPVIMVSGYLENDTIRDLIKEGVGGVFLKPLNIFSLLERTSELIEESRMAARSGPQDSGAEEEEGAELRQTKLSFPFNSYPCKSPASTAFAEQLYSLRSFKSTLSLIGGEGSQFRAICEDIRGFSEEEGEAFVYFTASSFGADGAPEQIRAAAREGASRVTCVVLNLEMMSEEQKALALALARREGAFGKVKVDLRVVFCLTGDLDTLYDEGAISEQLYIILGTAEVGVPLLRDCPEDIPFIGQQIVHEIVRERGLSSAPRFDSTARDFFRAQSWERNYEELRETIGRSMEASSSEVITASVLKEAGRSVRESTPASELESELKARCGDAVRAAALLMDGDAVRVADFFASTPERVQGYLREE